MSDLGNARGRIIIDTSDLRRAQNEVQNASRTMGQALGALGVGIGVREFARFAVEADRVATAYRRQSVAARELAGSQTQLNRLLEVYDRATGGVLGKAEALSDVTRLLSVGFADSAQELDNFARAVRGISVATGRPQDFVVTQLQLELLNQTGFRLDQIGLGMEEVRQRADALAAANSNLSREQAYQTAVLEVANDKFGNLTRSAEAQATGMERLRKAWDDLQLSLGQGESGPLNRLFETWANDINRARQELEIFAGWMDQVERAGRQFRFDIGISPLSPDTEDAIERARRRGPAPHSRFLGRPAAPPRFRDDQTAAIRDWAQSVAQIERQAANDRLDATNQYEQQRSDAIRSYEQTIAREAQSFAVQRARAEEDHARALSDIRANAAQREVLQAQELARTIARAQADSADRLADLAEDLERNLGQRRADSAERVAEWEEDRQGEIEQRRKDSAARLLEIEADFSRERARALRDNQLREQQAAARLDARALFFEQQRFRLESAERIDARNRATEDERTSLQKAIDQINQAHQERLEDEKKALDKSISQAKEAYNRQVADEKEALDKRIAQANEAYNLQLEAARTADDQRIEDMEADFLLRKTREDADRAVRLGQLAADHNAQLIEMDRAHGERLKQIERHAGEERAQIDEQFKQTLVDLGIQVDGVIEEQKRATDSAITEFDRWFKHVEEKFKLLQPIIETPPVGSTVSEELQFERSGLLQQLESLDPLSDAYAALIFRINEIDNLLRQLTGGAPPVAASGIVAAAGAFTMPTPTPPIPLAATGTGGRSVNISAINVYGAVGQDEQRLAVLVRQELLSAVRQAGGM